MFACAVSLSLRGYFNWCFRIQICERVHDSRGRGIALHPSEEFTSLKPEQPPLVAAVAIAGVANSNTNRSCDNMVVEKARAHTARRVSDVGRRPAARPQLRSHVEEEANGSASAVSATPSGASATPSASAISEVDGEAAEKHEARPMTVGVRVRPLSSRETKKAAKSVLTVTDGSKIFAADPDEKMGGRDYLRLDKTKDHAYRFDNAFGPEASSLDIYRACLQPVVRAVGQGYHGSCFAYGATGSGKTYTMMGESAAPGVMPMAVQELFELSEKEDDYNWSFALTHTPSC